jgi:hypothetical protein
MDSIMKVKRISKCWNRNIGDGSMIQTQQNLEASSITPKRNKKCIKRTEAAAGKPKFLSGRCDVQAEVQM